MLASWLEDAEQSETMGQIYTEALSAQDGCERMMEALNALFPSEVIDQYVLLDLSGLPVLDGIENDAFNVTGEQLIVRLKNIRQKIEADGTADVNAMLSELSGYIVTNMKSGAMMKIVDKADRYDRESRMAFPVMELQTEGEQMLVPDLAAFEGIMLDIYYDDTSLWTGSSNTQRENENR